MVASVAGGADSGVAGGSVAVGTSGVEVGWDMAGDVGVGVAGEEHDASRMAANAREQKMIRFITDPLFLLHRIA
jgi:hypothetical protein